MRYSNEENFDEEDDSSEDAIQEIFENAIEEADNIEVQMGFRDLDQQLLALALETARKRWFWRFYSNKAKLKAVKEVFLGFVQILQGE